MDAENVKFGFPVILPFDTVLVTQQISWYVWQPGWQASTAYRIAMQISDSEAYAKEVSVSQIPRAYHARYKTSYGLKLANPSPLEFIQTLFICFPLLAAHKPTILYAESCTWLFHLEPNVNIYPFPLLCVCANNCVVPMCYQKEGPAIPPPRQKRGKMNPFHIKGTILANQKAVP